MSLRLRLRLHIHECGRLLGGVSGHHVRSHGDLHVALIYEDMLLFDYACGDDLYGAHDDVRGGCEQRGRNGILLHVHALYLQHGRHTVHIEHVKL